MGAGRCGTTYLLNELNKIPGVNIYGENSNLFIDLIKITKKLEFTIKKSLISKKYTNLSYKNIKYINTEWYNDIKKLEKIKLVLKRHILNYFDKNKKLTGFKEIRFLEKENVNLLKYFEDYYEVYYIHLTRDIEKQSKSGWWKEDKKAKEMINIKNYNIENVLGENKRYLKIDLDEIKDDISKIRNFLNL